MKPLSITQIWIKEKEKWGKFNFLIILDFSPLFLLICMFRFWPRMQTNEPVAVSCQHGWHRHWFRRKSIPGRAAAPGLWSARKSAPEDSNPATNISLFIFPNEEELQKKTSWTIVLKASSFPSSAPTNWSCWSTRSTAEFRTPTLTQTRSCRWRRHQLATGVVCVALNMARLTRAPSHAWYNLANCSRNPCLPSSNNLSLSSTTSHSTLQTFSYFIFLFKKSGGQIVKLDAKLAEKTKEKGAWHLLNFMNESSIWAYTSKKHLAFNCLNSSESIVSNVHVQDSNDSVHANAPHLFPYFFKFSTHMIFIFINIHESRG